MAGFWGAQPAAPGQPAPAPTPAPAAASSGFWGSQPAAAKPVVSPSISDLEQQAQTAKDTADQSNSITGLFKNAVGSVWSAVSSAVNPNNTTPSGYLNESLQGAEQFGQATEANPFAGIGYIGKGIADAATSSFNDTVNSVSDDIVNAQEGNDTGKSQAAIDTATLAKIATGVAGVLFSPISGAFSGAQKIPVLKQAADVLNIPFTVAGVAGKLGTGGAIDAIPDSVISEDSKNILREPLENLGSLVAQVVIGGKIMDKVSSVVTSGRTITPVEARNIVTEVKTENDPIFNPASHPEAATPIPHSMTHAEYAKSVGYEPITPDENLPTIRFGTKAPSELPSVSPDSVPDVLSDTKSRVDALAPDDRTSVISRTRSLFGKGQTWADASEQALNEFETAQRTAGKKTTIVPIENADEAAASKAPVSDTVETAQPSQKSGTSSKEAPKPVEKISQPETAAKSDSGLAAGVKADAIKAGLEDSIGKLPQYGRIDMKEQAALAKDLIDKNPDLAMKVARGEADSPIPHLLPESVFTALRVIARETNDAGLFQRLAEHSNTTEMARVMGQRIKALDSGVREDALSIMEDVKAAREATVERKTPGTIAKTKTEMADGIRAEIKKNISTRPTWEDFVKEIQCAY